jgi:hypothetical protein
VIDLEDTYRRLARTWTHDELAARYQDAQHRGAQLVESPPEQVTRPVQLLATAIPPCATFNVAIHMLHALPDGVQDQLPRQLVDVAETNAANALHRAHTALETDGAAHGYTADEWLSTAYDITVQLLEPARLDSDPPTLVRAAQDAISWLSRAVVELDRDSAEIPSTLAEALARLLTGSVFAGEALAR